MIELKQDILVFSFPEVHRDAVLRIDFQRTLRIPDDDRADECGRHSVGAREGPGAGGGILSHGSLRGLGSP